MAGKVYKKKPPTAAQVNAAYDRYVKRITKTVGAKNKAGKSNILPKDKFIKKNFPEYGSTRTRATEKGLKAGGLTYSEIKKLR
jgi:hypothetical protein